MAARLATGEETTVKLGRAGPFTPALTASEYRSAPDGETVHESTSLKREGTCYG
jgi:hypothetical protein